MATVKTNAIVNGFRGKFGKIVFRTIGDKTFVSPEGRKPDKKKETEAQRTTRVAFRKASESARTILKDPVQKAYYLKQAKALKLPNAYTAALTDYMRKPNAMNVQRHDSATHTVHKPALVMKGVHAIGTFELKSNLHKIIDRMEDERLLKAVYRLLDNNF